MNCGCKIVNCSLGEGCSSISKVADKGFIVLDVVAPYVLGIVIILFIIIVFQNQKSKKNTEGNNNE